jgi:hypothetical protein
MKITPETQELAAEVFNFIQANPERHDQNIYFSKDNPNDDTAECGTSMCIAGTTLFLEYGIDNYVEALNFSGHGFISETAAPLLGLESKAESDALFHDYNNESALQTLKYIVTGDEFGYANAVKNWKEKNEEYA